MDIETPSALHPPPPEAPAPPEGVIVRDGAAVTLGTTEGPGVVVGAGAVVGVGVGSSARGVALASFDRPWFSPPMTSRKKTYRIPGSRFATVKLFIAEEIFAPGTGFREPELVLL